eukprot:jgi/Ulvmu1/7044/UM033_0104.1
MPDPEIAPVTNTAMRIGTSHLVPPVPSAPNVMPAAPMARPPHPAASVPMQTQAAVPAAMNIAAPVESQRTFTPAAASSQGTAQTAATPLVSHAQVQSSATPHGSQPRRTPANGSSEHRACNCKNSRCLKLYCECFASGRYCNACNCSNCMNNKDHEQARSKAIETILERNPNAFRPKIQIQQGEDGAATAHVTRHSKGCSCRKSNCLKKYCECFQAGICCASTCRCKDCRNYDGSEQLLAVMRREDVDTTTRHTQGMSDGKRARNGARPGAPVQGSHQHHALRQKRDPAREAIKTSRDKRMHEVLASMLTTLHTEAWSKEKAKRDLQQPVANQAEGDDERKPVDKPLSDYYIETEGILLGEFGSFLGKLADKIDEQLSRHDGT